MDFQGLGEQGWVVMKFTQIYSYSTVIALSYGHGMKSILQLAFSSPVITGYNPWRIHGAAIYGNMDPINIPQILAYVYIYTIHGSYG